MINYIIRRLAYGCLTILAVLGLLFVLFFTLTKPDDIARRAVGEKASQQVRDAWKAKHGYDKPLFVNRTFSPLQTRHYTDTLLADHYHRMLTFNFGNRDSDDTPIMHTIRTRAIPSLFLTVPLFLEGLFIGIIISLFVALFRETYIDRLVLVICVVTMSVPMILFIILGQFWFGRVLHWFPISGFEPDPILIWRFLGIPLLVGLFTSIGGSVRFYRTVFIEEANKDYVRTARAKGCGEGAIMFRHVLRNAMIPILTNVVMTIPFLFTGSLMMESFFGIPGLGAATVDAIGANDFSMLRTMVYIGALIFIVAHIITDISYTIADPRVRLE
jgi:peptide/nickel transport system permease protein